jgi:hypothetical protein
MPVHVKKRAAAICTRTIHAKFENFVNPGNRSNIKNVAPDPGICTRVKFAAAQQGPDFLISAATLARTPQTGGTAGPRENYSPPRSTQHDCLPRTSFRRCPKESVMGVIAWIALGVAGGLRANILLPGKRSRGPYFHRPDLLRRVLGGGWTPDYRGCRRHRAAPGGHGRVGADHHAVRAGGAVPAETRAPGHHPAGRRADRVSLRIGTTPPPPALPDRIPTPPHAAAANGAAVS